jgi:hypothetical protein
MADESLQPIFEELNGTAPVKPFECVGTVEEVRACMKVAGISTGSMTAGFVKILELVEGPTVEEILNRFNTQHFLPAQFEQILKSRLYV